MARLPGIGRKSAQRLAYHVLSLPEEEAYALSDAIAHARQKLHPCKNCFSFTDEQLCPICRDESRDKGLICVVRDPRDIAAMERLRDYKGLYHVLGGSISPMRGIGPDDIRIRELLGRISGVSEVVLATNPDIEGEATATYIARLIRPMGIKVTRIAYGVPVGSELEYADDMTLLSAFRGRTEIE